MGNTAHVVDMFSNPAIPACTRAAAIALAGTEGYESVI
jgi:hypothetical protein